MIKFLYLLLVIPASLQIDDCTEEGVFGLQNESKFVTCSIGDDGKLLAQYGECDPHSIFNPETQECTLKKSALQRKAVGSKCYNKGYYCASCTTLDYCWDRGNGLEVVATEDCGGDTPVCSAYNSSCVRSDWIPQCASGDSYKFTCNYGGLFPDPYLCDTYYFCPKAGDEAQVLKCPEDYYYDPLYYECVKYEENKKLPCPHMKACTSPNQMLALERNPNIYYICINFGKGGYTNKVFRCPRNEIFNGKSCEAAKSRTLISWTY